MFDESPGITALHLRDYFWLHTSPASGEEKTWRRVECAGIRIAESLGFMLGDYSFETRVQAAKRVRRAARECLKLIPNLVGVPEWTLDASAAFEALADTVLEELDSPSGTSRQH